MSVNRESLSRRAVVSGLACIDRVVRIVADRHAARSADEQRAIHRDASRHCTAATAYRTHRW